MSIQHKVALITGASSGIGKATALKLAEAGVKVGLAARRSQQLEDLAAQIRQSGGEALVLTMDVTDPDSVQTGVELLARTYGSIDIAFNNAGLMPISDIDQLKTHEWQQMLDVNVQGLLNTTAAVLPYMQRQGSGHIVNTSSIAGRKVFPGLSVYCATKHAVTAFSEGLRLEVAPKHNVRVTCIQPGAVESELFEHISDENYRQQMEGLKQQMTFLKAEDIANTVLFALQAPAHVNVAEIFVLPTNQPW